MKKEKKIVCVRFDIDVYEKLKELAKGEDRTVPNQVMIIVKHYFGDYKKL